MNPKKSLAKTFAMERPSELEVIASELAMAVWNKISQLPQMHKIRMRDYPGIYEAVHSSLKHYSSPSK